MREKIVCVEDTSYTADYHDPEKRSIANAITVEFNDGTVFDEVAVEYPIGHARRRVEGIPLLIEKYKTNLARIYDADKQKAIIDLCLDYEKFVATCSQKHVFGSAESNTLRSKNSRSDRILWSIGVGANF